MHLGIFGKHKQILLKSSHSITSKDLRTSFNISRSFFLKHWTDSTNKHCRPFDNRLHPHSQRAQYADGRRRCVFKWGTIQNMFEEENLILRSVKADGEHTEQLLQHTITSITQKILNPDFDIRMHFPI